MGNAPATDSNEGEDPRPKLLPRETGHDIGMGSPVPLSAEAVGIITRLRNMKVRIYSVACTNSGLTYWTLQDEDEDWGRWRDVVFRAKGALAPHGFTIPLPPQNKRKRGGPALSSVTPQSDTAATPVVEADVEPLKDQLTVEDVAELATRMSLESSASAATSEVPTPDPTPPPVAESSAVAPETDEDGMQYCPECFVPLHPDPKPESLYIFLHALKYTTSLGTFETQMPEWAAEGWEWDR